MLHALDVDEHLVQVQPIPQPWPAAAQACGEGLAEFSAPAPDGLIRDDNAPLSQKLLGLAQAEAEHVIQPDSVTNDFGGEPVAVVRVGCGFIPASLDRLSPDYQNRLP